MTNNFQTLSIIIRPDDETDWYTPTSEYQTYVKKEYVDTGKILESIKNLSPDDLTMKHTITWDSVESADEWFYDATCIEYRHARDAYEVSKGFIRVRPDHPVRGIGWA